MAVESRAIGALTFAELLRRKWRHVATAGVIVRPYGLPEAAWAVAGIALIAFQ